MRALWVCVRCKLIAMQGIPVETISWQFQEGDKIAFSNQGLVS